MRSGTSVEILRSQSPVMPPEAAGLLLAAWRAPLYGLDWLTPGPFFPRDFRDLSLRDGKDLTLCLMRGSLAF